MAIFGQFTKRAQQVLMTAQECATREGQPYVGTLHFLYGLLDVGEAPESVTRHIQKEDVKQVLDQIDDEVSLHPGHGPVQMTPRARRVLDGSIIESRRLGQLYVGTEHMWLGILANPNWQGGGAAGASGRGCIGGARRAAGAHPPAQGGNTHAAVRRDGRWQWR